MPKPNKVNPTKYSGLMTSESKNKAMAMTPVHKYHEGRPSRYKSKNKDRKIIAEPASGCNKIRRTGNKIIPIPIACSFSASKYVCESVIYFANNKAVTVFINSEGCNPNPPNSYQLVCPLMVLLKAKSPITALIPTA